MDGEAAGDFAMHAPAATGFGRIDRYRAYYRRRTFPRHAHGYYAFAAIEAGAERIFVRGREHVVAPGGAVLLNPGDVHTGAPFDARGWTYSMLVVEEAQMAELMRGATGRPDLPLFTAPVAEGGPLTAAIRRAASADAKTGPLALEESLLALARLGAGAPGADCKGTSSEDMRLARIRDLLHARLAERVTLADLAHASGLSRGYLVTAFARRYGLPPSSYQFQLRLDRARRLLIEGDLPLADVALACGFYDQSDLTRHFARSYGITPGRFRRQMNIRQDLPA